MPVRERLEKTCEMANLGALDCGDDFVSQLAGSWNERAKSRLWFVNCCDFCAGTRVDCHYDLVGARHDLAIVVARA